MSAVSCLVGAGSSTVITMTLYTPEALGLASSEFAGYQGALRFAFKMLAGLGLGWLLTRHSPKVGVYFPNYVSSLSKPDRIRQNLAYMQVMSLPIGLTPAVFGVISDTAGHVISFVVALALSMTLALRLPS